MLNKRPSLVLLAALTFALIVSACGSPTPTITPQPAATNTIAATTAPATATTGAATIAATTAPTTAATEAATTGAASAATTAPTSAATTAVTSAAATTASPATMAATTAPTSAATSAVAVVSSPTAASAATTSAATTAATVMAATSAAATTAPTTVAMAQQETPPATKPATLPQCATSGVLQVGSDASYPPFETVNETTNKIEGFDVDLLNAMGQRAGFTPNFHNALFDTIFTALSYGQYDLVASASTITEERQKTVSFSNPYFKYGPVIVVRQADASTVKGPADLAGKTIGVQLGTTGAEAAKKIASTKGVKEYPTAPEAYQALANGDVEAVVDDTVPALTIIANRPELKLAVVGEPLGTEYYGIAVRKDCTELLNKINKALGEVIADGTYATLYEKYFGEAPSPEFRKGAAGVVPTQAATMAATMAK